MTVIKCQTKSCSKIIPDGEQKTIVAGYLGFTVCRKCHDMIVSFISNKGAMDQFMITGKTTATTNQNDKSE